MWNSSRRIALFSTSLVLLGVGLFGAAWLAHWLPIEVGEAETGDLATRQTLEELDALDWSSFSDHGATEESSNGPRFVDSQSEPEFGSGESFAKARDFVDRDRWLDNGNSTGNARHDASLDSAQLAVNTLPNQFPDSNFSSEHQPGSAGPGANRPLSAGSSAQSTDRERAVRSTSGTAAGERTVQQISADEFQSAPARLFDTEEPPTFGEARGFPTEVAFADRAATLDLFAPEEAEPDEAAPSFEAELTSSAGLDDDAPVRTAARTVSSEAAGTEHTGESTEVKLQQIDDWLANRNFVAAHRELSTLYWNHPELKPVILERIEKNAQAIYFSPEPHFLEPYEIQSGDFLQRIAPKYGINWEYLAALNRIDPRKVRAGQKLKVIKGPFSVFVDLSDFELTVHCHGFFVKRYQIGTGRNSSTPVGKFAVLERIPTPQYTDPNGRVIEGGHPTNPLGTHWIDLGDSYGIHGTIEPGSIGKAESAGCVRMRNEDVVEVYNFLVKGSEVVIRP
jgi:lipoprotein-anchoring transpeptidase ErfK/SrfK